MSERCCGPREACRVCASTEWVEAHFVAGAGIVCLACWREIEQGKREAARKRLDSAPGVLVPPTQLAFTTREMVKPGEVANG